MPTSSVSRQEAARELLIRRRARKSILHYAGAIDIPGKPVGDDPDTEFFKPVETTIAHHHRLILQAIDETSRTPHGRLMIFAPPGSAKSTFASVVFPSQFLGRQPDRRLILASYGDDLARKMGRRVRSIARQPRYRSIWNTRLSTASSAADQFALENGSEFMAAGILSGVTGNRGHGVILDDPHKGRAEANSETIRKRTREAYQDDLLTRLVPGGFVVIIQTRWHQLDLAGGILPEDWNGQSGMIRCRDGMVWRVICLQARCEREDDPLGRRIGEYIWPDWFDPGHWAQFEAMPRTWSALYQQRPSPEAGDLFKPDQISVIDTAPAAVEWVRAWDLASTTEERGDWTAGVKLGIVATPNGPRYVIADMERFHRGPDERDAALVNTAKRDGTAVRIGLAQDPGQAGKTQVLYLTRQLPGHRVVTSPESGDKVTRAEPFAAQVNVGNVSMVRGTWNDKLIDELRNFPNGAFDDQVDALSRAFEMLLNRRTASSTPLRL